MNNNDCLRRIRYILDFDDSKMIAIFGLANMETDRAEISAWLKKDDDPDVRASPSSSASRTSPAKRPWEAQEEAWELKHRSSIEGGINAAHFNMSKPANKRANKTC